MLLYRDGSHWTMQEQAAPHACQGPVLPNSLELQTFGDLLLQVHHFVEQVLKLQVVGINFLLGLKEDEVSRAIWGGTSISKVREGVKGRLKRGQRGGMRSHLYLMGLISSFL